MSQKQHHDVSLVLKAIPFVDEKHRRRHRKSKESTPYVNQVVNDAILLLEQGGISDIRLIVTALLHDTLEDTETTREELEQSFGAGIFSIVEEVSDNKCPPKAERERLQIEQAAKASVEASHVGLAIRSRISSTSERQRWYIGRWRDRDTTWNEQLLQCTN